MVKYKMDYIGFRIAISNVSFYLRNDVCAHSSGNKSYQYACNDERTKQIYIYEDVPAVWFDITQLSIMIW
jgi:hypothetical protein